MRTFVILFAIAICLPAEAQRVKENVQQKIVISSELLAEDSEQDQSESQSKKSLKEEKAPSLDRSDAQRKQ
jgi:hypothetical protein